MYGVLARLSVFAGCLVAVTTPLAAQEVIHALTGTVSSIDARDKTIALLQDTGSTGVYTDVASGKVPKTFDKKIAADTTAAGTFSTQGAYVILFYYENADGRVGVALKSLGTGPFTSTVGFVERCDRGRLISVRGDGGALQTFRITDGTVGETQFGAVDGAKFDAGKGDHVRVVSAMVDGTPTALFVRDM